MMRKFSVWLAIALCGCVVAAGCTSKVRGEPTAARPGDPAAAAPSSGPSSSPGSGPASPSGSGSSSSEPSGSAPSSDTAAALAKLRTTDVCSYMRGKAFAALDPQARPTVIGGDYESCDLSVPIKTDGKTVQYQIASRYLDGSDAKGIGTSLRLTVQQGTRSGHTVFTGSSDEVGCIRAIVLNAGLTLAMTAQHAGTKQAQVCKVADAMFDSALQQMQSDGLHELTVPSTAVVRTDFCAELDAAASTFLGSVSTTTARLHGCVWAKATSSISVSLGMDQWPPGFPPPNAESATIGGHPCVLGISKNGALSFSINQVQMGHSPLDPQQYDVISVLISAKSGSDVESRIRTFLSAVAGLA